MFLPMVTLEELDDNKKGMSEVARNARQASRFLDEIVSQGRATSRSGYLAQGARAAARPPGRLFLQTHSVNVEIPESVASQKADNVILGVALLPQAEVPEARGRAGVQGHQHAHQGACDRDRRPRTTSTTRSSRTPTSSTPACMQLPEDFWDKHGKDVESWQEHGRTLYRVQGPAGARDAREPVRLPRGRPALPRDRDARRAARPRCCRRSRTTRTTRTTSGASRRATASRTSR